MHAKPDEPAATQGLPAEFTILGCHIDSARCRIDTGRSTLKVEPQVMRVLRFLALRAGQVVLREEFLRECWPGVIVDDPALTRCITRLRQIFDDDARSPHVIETIPKIGYRLIAPVTTSATAARPRQWTRQSGWLAAAMLAVAALVAWQVFDTPSDPHLDARADYDNGIAAYAQYTYTENENAIVFFERALAIDPEFANAHAGLANALSQQALRYSGRRLPDADRHALLAVQLQPESAEAHRALGFARAASGRFDEALQSYATSIEIDPATWQSAYNAAEIYLRQRNFSAARAMYLHVIEYRPENAVAMAGIGYLESRRGNVDAAREWLERSLAIRPVQPMATAHYALLELAAGQSAAAIERCRDMQVVFGDDYDCLRVTVVAGFLQDDIEMASRALARIEMHWPDDSYANLGKALVLAKQGQNEAALRMIRPVLDGEVSLRGSARFDWDADWLRAVAHAIAGDEAAAFRQLNNAVANGYRFSLWDGMEPAFAGIRADARFSEHLVAMDNLSRVE